MVLGSNDIDVQTVDFKLLYVWNNLLHFRFYFTLIDYWRQISERKKQWQTGKNFKWNVINKIILQNSNAMFKSSHYQQNDLKKMKK